MERPRAILGSSWRISTPGCSNRVPRISASAAMWNLLCRRNDCSELLPPCNGKRSDCNGEKSAWGKGIAGFGGIIGIHSTFSTGKDAPEAYIAKAREMGLDFILFTEDFASMTPEKWKQLKALCEKQSDKQFLALPGIEYRDEIDRRFLSVPISTGRSRAIFPPTANGSSTRNAWYDFFNMAMHGPFLREAESLSATGHSGFMTPGRSTPTSAASRLKRRSPNTWR